MDFKNLGDWYNIKQREILNYGGCGLLDSYNSSLIKAIETLYPEHQWQCGNSNIVSLK